MFDMNATTPKEISEEILKFCKEIDPSTKPFFLKLFPVEGCLYGECYGNVENHIKKNGGNFQYGWIIWETPNNLLDAEFHAVWVDKDGKHVDITPKVDGEETILFLPDSKRKFTGEELIDNIRKSLVNTAYTRAITKFGEKRFELSKKYYQGTYPIEIPQFELDKLSEDYVIFYRKELREDRANGLEATGKNKPCPCGSKKKYKMCCGA